MKPLLKRGPRAGYRLGRCYITCLKTRRVGLTPRQHLGVMQMSTRSLSALVSASCLFLLIACSKKEEAPPKVEAGPPAPAIDTDAEKVVNVYNWSDYIDPEALKSFTAETGVKVNYEVMD